MFQWDKSINALHVPASRVVSLFRSMREVQLALPGVPSQQASAFLCQYQVEGGLGTVAVFHLHKAPVLAFYCSEPRVVSAQKADSMLDQGLNFVESMGFLLTDQDLHLLDAADQEMLWASLPLQNGLIEQAGALPGTDSVQVSVAKPDSKKAPPGKPAAAEEPHQPKNDAEVHAAVVSPVAVAATGQVTAKDENESAAAENVNDLLAAVEAMRAKRPGLRARRQPPSAEELERRRQQLRETVGRILASL